MRELEPIQRLTSRNVEVVPASVSTAPRVPELQTEGPLEEGSGFMEYWRMVRRHPYILIAAFILGGTAGFMTTLRQPRIYQARVTLEIQGLNEDFLNMRNINPTVSGASGFYPEIDIQTQVRIIESRALNDRVVARMVAAGSPGNLIPPDRLTSWRRVLKAEPPTQGALWQQALSTAAGSIHGRNTALTRIIEVTCDSTDPRVASTFLNLLSEEYIEQNLEARWRSTEHTGEWLTRQLQDLKSKLERAQSDLQAYGTATGLIFTSDKSSNVDDLQLAQLGGLQKELTEAEADRVRKEARFGMISNTPVDTLPDILDDHALAESQRTLVDLRRQQAQLRVSFTPNHPEVRRVEAQMASLEGELVRQRDRILQRIKNDFEAAQYREKLLTASYQAQARRVSEKAAQIVHYNLLKREVDTTRELYESMLQKLKEASVASALRATNIRVVDAAESPGIPYRPDVPRTAMAGVLAGLVFGIAVIVLRERSDRTIQGPGEAIYYLKVPELGVVPIASFSLRGAQGSRGGMLQPAGTSLELSTWNDKTSIVAEAFRNTLTSILFSDQNAEAWRVIVVTSASPREGKTTLVSNLSVALAEIQSRVLLVDGDTRRPRVHSVFGLENTFGLTDILGGDGPLEWDAIERAIQPTAVPHLFILPSGKSRHSSNLLYSTRLPELLRLVRARFDTTLIDTPPMVNIADARVFGRHADGVILAIRSTVTTRDSALRAKQRLSEDGITVIGTILNAWNPNLPGYKYYKYYHNYYDGYYHYYGQNGTSSKKK